MSSWFSNIISVTLYWETVTLHALNVFINRWNCSRFILEPSLTSEMVIRSNPSLQSWFKKATKLLKFRCLRVLRLLPSAKLYFAETGGFKSVHCAALNTQVNPLRIDQPGKVSPNIPLDILSPTSRHFLPSSLFQ